MKRWKSVVLVNVALLATVSASSPVEGIALAPLNYCSSEFANVVMGRAAYVLGWENGITSGAAAPGNPGGDKGVFVLEAIDGADHYYVMSGSSPAAQCLDRATRGAVALLTFAGSTIEPVRETARPVTTHLDVVLCAAQQPTSVWMEWGNDTDARTQEIEAYGSPVLPCPQPID